MSEKRTFYRFISWIAGGLIGMAVLIFCVDPFYHYHDAWFGLPVVLENAVYQTCGAARNFSYDSVIVGFTTARCFFMYRSMSKTFLGSASAVYL